MKRRNFITSGIVGNATLMALPGYSHSVTNQDSKLQPFYVAPREALSPGPGKTDVRTIIQSYQTNKQFSNVEVAVSPKQMGPSPHIHAELDELMYVVEGTATVLIGNEVYEVKPGGWNFRPRGIVHSFWNAHDTPLRFIDCFFNQNFEDYLDQLFHKIIPEMVSLKLTPTAPEIKKQMDSLDKEFGITWFHNQRQGIVDKYGLNE
jgi:quercetin dioxygenase-like cupin family protein